VVVRVTTLGSAVETCAEHPRKMRKLGRLRNFYVHPRHPMMHRRMASWRVRDEYITPLDVREKHKPSSNKKMSYVAPVMRGSGLESVPHLKLVPRSESERSLVQKPYSPKHEINIFAVPKNLTPFRKIAGIVKTTYVKIAVKCVPEEVRLHSDGCVLYGPTAVQLFVERLKLPANSESKDILVLYVSLRYYFQIMYRDRMRELSVIDTTEIKAYVVKEIRPVMEMLDTVQSELPPWSPSAVKRDMSEGLPGTSGYDPAKREYGPPGRIIEQPFQFFM
jgi:hypothetical protein